jgi:hypothetical protein
MVVIVQPFILVRTALAAGCFQVQTKIGVAAQLLAEALTIVVIPLPSIAYIPFDLLSIPRFRWYFTHGYCLHSFIRVFQGIQTPAALPVKDIHQAMVTAGNDNA